MATFNNSENGYRFIDNDGYEIELTEDNYFVWLSRDEPLKDMAQVDDDRDGLSWSWFRYDVGDEMFNTLDTMARKVGTVVLKSTVTEDISQVFDQRHRFTDEEINDLLRGSDEQE